MPLPLKSFDELVNEQANAIQGSAQKTLDFNVGAILRALVESNAGLGLWLESLASMIVAVSRLGTSYRNDVDTFVNPFGLFRKPPTPTYASVTFSRFITTQSGVIPAGTFDLTTLVVNPSGALVSSITNGITYAVYADETNEHYDPAQNAYVIPTSTSSIDVPVVATTPGSIGNVLANQITTIASAIPYVDSVTNSEPFTNGVDAEQDSAVKTRFPLYLNSLSRATKQAIQFAVESVPGVVRDIEVENETVDAITQLGFFYVVVDDGSGNASDTLLSNVAKSVEAYRGFTIAYSIYAPTQVPVDIVLHAWTDGSVPDDIVQTNIVDAFENYIISKGFSALFPYSRIPEIAYDSDSSITNITDYTLQGSTDDLQLVGQQIMTVGTITVVMNA